MLAKPTIIIIIINFIIIDFLEGIKAARSDFGNTHILDCMYDVKTWSTYSAFERDQMGIVICSIKNGDRVSGSLRQKETVMVFTYSR